MKRKRFSRFCGSYTVIDKITVNLNIKNDCYETEFSNLGLKNIPISEEYPMQYDRLLCGGIWCIVQLEYEYIEEDKKNGTPISIRKLDPIQMPHVDLDELKAARSILPTTMALLPTIWLSLFGSCARSSTATHRTRISTWARI